MWWSYRGANELITLTHMYIINVARIELKARFGRLQNLMQKCLHAAHKSIL